MLLGTAPGVGAGAAETFFSMEERSWVNFGGVMLAQRGGVGKKDFAGGFPMRTKTAAVWG